MRSELARIRLIADLEIPAIRIVDVKTLELAVHVGPWVQAVFFEFGLHFGSVPRIYTPRATLAIEFSEWTAANLTLRV